MGQDRTRVPGDAGVHGGMSAGAVFAGHRIENEIGRGGMGVVYRARHLALERERALKVIASELSSDGRFRERFRRESRLAASIEHPNVIPIHNAGEEDGRLYIAMRLVEGSDLQRELAAGGPLDPARAGAIVKQAAAALDASHAAGLIHRDVKPANVLIETDGGEERVFLTDFGISHLAAGGDTITVTGEILGSPDYVAPEQAEGHEVDARSDVYSLGALLYFALTGARPFERDSTMATLYAHANAPRPRPSESAPWLPHAIDAVIARAMAVDPAARYETAGALAEAAKQALTDAGSPPARTGSRSASSSPPPAGDTPATRDIRRRRVLAGGVIAVGAVAVAFLLAARSDEDEAPRSADRASVVAATVRVGEEPTALTVGELYVWVASQATESLDRIDPATDDATQVPADLGGAPRSVVVGFGSVWVVVGESSELVRIDPDEDVPPVRIRVGAGPADVAIDDRFVWVANEAGDGVSRIDPETNRVTARVPVGDGPRAIAAGEDAVWTTNINDGTVTRIDPAEARTVGQPVAAGQRPSDIAVGGGAVWAMDNFNGDVIPIDPESLQPGDPVDVGPKPRGLKVGFGHVWVALGGDDSVVRIDPHTRQLVGSPVAVGDEPADLAIGAGSVWTPDIGAATVSRIDPG